MASAVPAMFVALTGFRKMTTDAAMTTTRLRVSDRVRHRTHAFEHAVTELLVQLKAHRGVEERLTREDDGVDPSLRRERRERRRRARPLEDERQGHG